MMDDLFTIFYGHMSSPSSLTESMWNGATAGLLTCVTLQPIDVIKTRLQEYPIAVGQSTQHRIMHVLSDTYKARAFWRGTTPTILRNVPGVALYFGAMEGASSVILSVAPGNSYLVNQKSKKLSSTGNAIVGAFARVTSGFALHPLTLIKIRMESTRDFGGESSKRTFVSVARDAIKKDGLVRGLYRGIGVTTLRDAPQSGLYLAIYREMQSLVYGHDRNLGIPNWLSSLMCSMSAGTISTVITQPLDLAKTRVQLVPSKYPNFLHALRTILKEEGIIPLFTLGLGPRLIRKGLSATLIWTIYEELKRRTSVKAP